MPEFITTSDYVAMFQLINNGWEHSHEIVILSIGSEENYVKISVRDTGKGIIDKDKRHTLTAEKIPQIFSGYSTTGGGLGLQVVKAITELRGGYVSLVTTRKTKQGLDSLEYSTKDGKCSIPNYSLHPSGTRFDLYFPR